MMPFFAQLFFIIMNVFCFFRFFAPAYNLLPLRRSDTAHLLNVSHKMVVDLNIRWPLDSVVWAQRWFFRSHRYIASVLEKCSSFIYYFVVVAIYIVLDTLLSSTVMNYIQDMNTMEFEIMGPVFSVIPSIDRSHERPPKKKTKYKTNNNNLKKKTKTKNPIWNANGFN